MIGPKDGLRSLIARLRDAFDTPARPTRSTQKFKARLHLESLEAREVLDATTLNGSIGVMVQFRDGSAYYSPDNTRLAGGGATTSSFQKVAGQATALENFVSLQRSGVLAQFNDGSVYWSPDADNLNGGTQTAKVYDGSAGKVTLVARQTGGVWTQFSDNSVTYSANYTHLKFETDASKRGLTKRVYDGANGPVKLYALRNGAVLVQFTNTNAVYYSPNGENLAGGGQTVRVYDGTKGAVRITGLYEGGVLVHFENTNRVNYSPDFKNLGGGGTTTEVYNGRAGKATLTAVRDGGVLAQFARSNAVYFSPDGKRLAGGGSTVRAYDGAKGAVRLTAVKEGVLTQFRTGAVYLSPTAARLAGGGSTVRVYDGAKGAVELVGLRNGGVMTKFQSNLVYFSPDSRNLAGGGSTQKVYNGASGEVEITPLDDVQSPVYTTTNSGLKIRDEVVGTGTAVTSTNNTVKVEYLGFLTADGKIFDSSDDHGGSSQFQLNNVIQGWKEGMIGMKEGGVRWLIVPPNLGYGANGSPPNIPGNATLTFRITLLDVVS